MNTESGIQPATEFPSSIAKPAIRALVGAGITRYEQLATYSAEELLALHGVGPKAIRILGGELAGRGLGFANH